MISGGERILNTIKSTTKYDMSTVSSTALRARTEITTEESDNNFITILKDRISSSELSDVPKDFENMIVNNNNIKEP